MSVLDRATTALQRPGAFGVAMVEGDTLVSAAVALPARGDDGRSEHNVAGLAHISTVVTDPDRWGEGLGARVLRALVSQIRRRGFPRAQLWTHRTNDSARRLYERLGFTLSARERVHDSGEPMVHYLLDLEPLEVMSRPAARVLCLDAIDRLILMQYRDPVDGHQLWEPPGGGIEPGESPREAMLREWREETGLAAPEILSGPTDVARDTFWSGRRAVVTEQFFLGRLVGEAVPAELALTDEEVDIYLGTNWISWRDLDSLTDSVEPDLMPVLRRLDPSGPWA